MGPGNIFPGLFSDRGHTTTLPTGETITLRGSDDFNRYISDNVGADQHALNVRQLAEREGYNPGPEFDIFYKNQYEKLQAERKARKKRNVGVGLTLLGAGSISPNLAIGVFDSLRQDFKTDALTPPITIPVDKQRGRIGLPVSSSYDFYSPLAYSPYSSVPVEADNVNQNNIFMLSLLGVFVFIIARRILI